MDLPEAPLSAVTLISPNVDDGFGSALAQHQGSLWIGAPHGLQGSVYRWDEESLTEVLQGSGRLGSHLAGTSTSLWAAAPLAAKVVDQNGDTVAEGDSGTGIALSATGHIASASGWMAPDGATGTSPGRPTAIHQDGDALSIGMAHGPVALTAGGQDWARPEASDEAGFSLSDGIIDGQAAWLVGAPAANKVYGLSQADLTIVRIWDGTGRFGHAITVADVDGDSTPDLVVGAPLAGDRGEVRVFTSMGSASQPLTLDSAEIRQAGTALLAGEQRLFIGAPGDVETPGAVLMVPLP